MSNEPHAAATRRETPSAQGASAEAEADALEQDYRAAEWSYDPETYAAPDLGNGDHPSGAPLALGEEWSDAQGSAAKITSRPNLRMAGRRPGEGPKDTESKILAVSAQLQELLEQRKEEVELGGLLAANAPGGGRRTGFKPAGNAQPGSRLPVAPPISLPVRAFQPPKDSGWPGLGRARAQWNRSWTYGALGLIALGGVFWLGRLSQSRGVGAGASGKAPAAPVVEPALDSTAWTSADVELLDQALAADQAGDLDGAFKTASQIALKSRAAYGLKGYLANVEMRRGNAVDAEGILSGKADLGTAAGKEQMGFVLSRNREFDKATDWLKQAAESNPFPAENFYRLGEALRRKGAFSDAIIRFGEALRRIPAEAEFIEQREQTAFKKRLAQIEGGRRADVAPDVEKQLKSPSVNGFWLLTAAALALQDNDLPAALNWLGRGKTALGPERFDSLLGDYYFRVFADRPELAAYFAKSSAARLRRQASPAAFFIDP